MKGERRNTVDIKELECGIIVADKDYSSLLYSFRNSHPELRLKIWNENDLLRRLSCDFDKGKMDPIPYLLKKGITYPDAKNYLNLIRVADLSKNAKLLSLFEELKQNGYLKFDEFGEIEISKGCLFLFEKQEDVELHALLKRKGIAFKDLSIEDLGVQPALPDNEHPPIYLFADKFYQFNYLFSCLKKQLLDEPDSSKKILVVSHGPSDEFYARLSGSIYGVPPSFNVRIPMLSNVKIKKKVTSIHLSQSFAFSEEEKQDEELASLYSLIEHYGLAGLDPSFAYATLLDILSANQVHPESVPGIGFTNSYPINPGLLFYVTNFQYGDFYSISSDKNVLSDEGLLDASANPSYVKTQLDKRKKRNFLIYNHIVFLSRVAKHLTDKIYDSPFIEEFGWKDDVIKKKWNEDGVFTSDSEKLYRTDQLDSAFYHKPIEDLISYDHSYKKVEGDPLIKVEKWSASKLERYPFCPFQYLLDAMMPFDPSSSRRTGLGTLNHFMMEHLYRDDFDFDARFEEAAEDYRKNFERNGQPFDAEEEGILSIYRHWLKRFMNAMRQAKTNGLINLSEDTERFISYALQDEEGNEYLFSGRIDKILFTEFNGKKYYTIIDYKSGAEDFNLKTVFLGASTQLPLYALALREEKNANLTKNATFAGFGINHSFVNSPKKAMADGWVSENVTVKCLKFSGPLKEDKDFWKSLDETGLKKDGEIKVVGGTFFSASPLFGNEETGSLLKNDVTYAMKDLLNDAYFSSMISIKGILANDFPIKPTSSDMKGNLSSLPCRYCAYGDICYRNKALDSTSYIDEIRRHFEAKEDEGGEDDNDEEVY